MIISLHSAVTGNVGVGYSFTFHHDIRVVYKKVWGVYTSDDSARCHQIWDRINLEGDVVNYNELQDLREVTSYGVTALQMRALAEHYETLWNEGGQRAKRMAYVAPSPVVFGTGRIYDALISATGIDFRVFTNIEEGAAFLDISNDDLARIESGSTPPVYTSES